jgi:hypothetical protein
MADDRLPTMPIGHQKGVPLCQIPEDELRRTREWCREREDEGMDWSKLINAIDEEIESRQGLPLFGDGELPSQRRRR